jgi:glutamine amidotransferase
MRVVVVDSGVGNIPNAVRGLTRAGAEVTLSADPEVVAAADRIVVPGVGAFPAAMERLLARGLDVAIREAAKRGVPLLGICLGHQLLFEGSEEFGETAGLCLLPGRVVSLPATVRVPHMGWNALVSRRSDPLLEGLPDDAFMYFVHSFHAQPDERDLVATVDVGGTAVCAVARRGAVCGVQFHPEKSGAAGSRLLANFLKAAA